MVIITFPSKETRKKALGYLLGRFSGQALEGGGQVAGTVFFAENGS
jgi:hypothetical protein